MTIASSLPSSAASSRVFVLGITGGIGSGKSYISALLRQHFGIPVYDCDTQAKRLTVEDEGIRRGLMSLIGPVVYEGSVLQKSVLARFLFAGEENARAVNAIIHPVVFRHFQEWVSLESDRFSSAQQSLVASEVLRSRVPLVAVESAILYESGLHALVDKVLYVDASQQVRIARACQRDGATPPQIMQRIRQQDTDSARQRADYIIHNEQKDAKALIGELHRLIEAIAQQPLRP